jgi:hypothetical protein
VSALLKNAEEIFATARAAGADDCDFAIFVRHDGALHMVSSADSPLESLRACYGAAAAYRVQRAHGRVRVEARNGGSSCLLTAASPERALRPALADFPRYLMLN